MQPTTKSGILAVERHNGRTWSLIVLLALLIPAISVAMVPTRAARFALVLVGAVGIFAFAMAWCGFEYRFLRDALEIRMFGIRLRSIPRSAILSYAIEPWAFIRGYGIRGIGRTPRLRLVQQGGAHKNIGRRHLSGPQRSRSHNSRPGSNDGFSGKRLKHEFSLFWF